MERYVKVKVEAIKKAICLSTYKKIIIIIIIIMIIIRTTLYYVKVKVEKIKHLSVYLEEENNNNNNNNNRSYTLLSTFPLVVGKRKSAG